MPETPTPKEPAAPPRKGKTLTRAAMGLLCLLALVYFGLKVWDYFQDPFTTAAALYTRVEESVSANGWLIREEQLLPDESSGLLQLTRQENGLPLSGPELYVEDGPVPAVIHTGKRIGIDYAEEAADFPWRFWTDPL